MLEQVRDAWRKTRRPRPRAQGRAEGPKYKGMFTCCVCQSSALQLGCQAVHVRRGDLEYSLSFPPLINRFPLSPRRNFRGSTGGFLHYLTWLTVAAEVKIIAAKGAAHAIAWLRRPSCTLRRHGRNSSKWRCTRIGTTVHVACRGGFRRGMAPETSGLDRTA